jgi:hypothetical protein
MIHKTEDLRKKKGIFVLIALKDDDNTRGRKGKDLKRGVALL